MCEIIKNPQKTIFFILIMVLPFTFWYWRVTLFYFWNCWVFKFYTIIDSKGKKLIINSLI